jgi:iron(III) transport system permease protein
VAGIGTALRRQFLARPFLFGLLLVAVVGILTAFPTLYLLVNSFNIAQPGHPFVFGTSVWGEVLTDPRVRRSIGYTFLLSLRAPIGVTIAFVIAWLLIRIKIPGSRFIEYALWFSFFLPTLPLAIGWIVLLDPDHGLINDLILRVFPFIHEAPFSIYSVSGIMWVHLSLTVIPINVILLSPAIQQMDAVYEEAALTSGASNGMILRRITLPLLAPAVFTALIIGFIKSLETFEVEEVLGTPANINVYATTIYDYVQGNPPLLPQAMALSTFFLFVLLIVTMIYRFFMRHGEGHATIVGKTSRIGSGARPKWAYIASILMFVYLAIGVVVPIVTLLLGTFTKLFGFFFMKNAWTAQHWIDVFADSSFRASMANSFLVAILSAVIGTVCYALLAWCLVRSKLWGRQLLSVFVWLPWSIPGILLGLSLLTLILNVRSLSVINGTIVPMVLIILIKEIPIGVQMLKTSIVQIASELEEAGQTSGARFSMIFRRITLPLIAPMFGSVFILVFVSAFRDISATILLSGPNSQTMPLLMIGLLEEGRFESAAVIGVVLSVVVLIMTVAMTKLQLRVGMGR